MLFIAIGYLRYRNSNTTAAINAIMNGIQFYLVS